YYEDRERQELARLDSCDVLDSPLSREVTYSRAVALAHVAELLDELLPDREMSDAAFRLSLSVLEQLKEPPFWMPITYFELWMTRLMGYLPDLSECNVCGRSLSGTPAFFHVLADGLFCLNDKRLASSEISVDSRALAAQIFAADPATSYRKKIGDCGNAGEDGLSQRS